MTQETGELHLWSRSREELWHKGATSGNTQKVRALRLDCDGDALLALVEPAGPACHTGERTCFHRGDLEPPAPHEILPGLERALAGRRPRPPEGSYTAELLADPPPIGAKVEEEAEEVARAAREESRRARGRGGRRRPVPPARAPALPRARASTRRRRCSVAAAAEARPRGHAVARRGARAGARAHAGPARHTFIDDCETPVSAFLKLRGDEPAFLLESAERGQAVGRWSFIGFRPR